jgi:hypothetical protein
MHIMFRTITAALGVGVLWAVSVTQASAGCDYPQQKAAPSPWQQEQPGQGQARFIRTALVTVSNEEPDDAPIVGMWKVAFTAKGNTNGIPDGAPIDKGYVQWHSDGTELLNSFRAPTTGQFCMGVWKRTGPSTYKLNHFALGWVFNPGAPVTGPGTGGATFAGTTNIREVVTLDRSGNSYRGTFTITSYTTDGNLVVPPTPIVGIVTGTRVTVDSTESEAGIVNP